jgi:uncharacterized protein YaeQ
MKASGRAEHVVVYSFSAVSHIWFKQIAKQIDRARNISIVNIPPETSAALEAMCKRNMQLQCTIQDGQVWLTDGVDTVQVERDTLLAERKY